MPFKPGQSGNLAGKPKGIKNSATLKQEERRARFDQKISEKWDQVIDRLPPTYVADQFIGKAKETIKVEGKIEQLIVELPSEKHAD